MISKISLKNFRQHRELTIDLQPGFTALRGENEAGKSTVLEAILFALFGIRAARNSDIATWGEPDKSVRVELWMTLPAGELHISRSKSAAEINYAGQTVTGQTECTKFIEAQLQLQPGLGPKLMVAKQRDIQGVLEQKNGQATELIEDLADLAVIDRIVDKLQAKYPTGNTKLVESRIETASNQVIGRKDAIEQLLLKAAELPSAEDIGRQDTTVDELKQQTENLQGELAAAKQERDAAVALNDNRAKVIRKLNAAQDYLAGLKNQMTTMESKRPAAPACTATLDELDAALADMERQRVSYRKYQTFVTKTANYEVLFEGSESDLRQKIEGLRAEVAGYREEASSLPHKIATLQAQIVAASVCGFCDKDVSQFPEVAEKNAALQKRIAGLEEDSRAVGSLKAAAEAELKRLTDILNVGQLPRSLDDSLYLVDDSVFPARVTWKGEVPTDPTQEIGRLQAERDAWVAFNAATNQFNRQLASLEQEVVNSQQEVAELEAAVALLPPCPDTSALSAAVEKLLDDINETAAASVAASRELERMQSAVEAHNAAMIEKRRSLLDAEMSLAEAREELAEITFNNGLVKKLRTVRPEIANKVWASVLGAVSHYFSVMRGMKSVVTKGDDMFMVDGKPVDSYSGSTMDVLGLALRIALIRTFLPTCDFMLLDEPFAACSDGRQTAALGFLAGAGFKQMLVITHEDISETVADTLLTL